VMYRGVEETDALIQLLTIWKASRNLPVLGCCYLTE
jgi:hypothetical protein